MKNVLNTPPMGILPELLICSIKNEVQQKVLEQSKEIGTLIQEINVSSCTTSLKAINVEFFEGALIR